LGDLQRSSEILPSAKLQSLQRLSEEGQLTDESMIKEIGERGLLLIAFGVAASNDPSLLRTAPTDYIARLTELGEHVKSSAPALLANSRIQELAQRFAASGVVTELSDAD